SASSSGSLEQSLPAAALRSCRMRGPEKKTHLDIVSLLHILAKPRALDARSLASWNSSLSDRLVSITDRLEESKGSNAVMSSALSQNSLPLFCRPESRNSPVDLSSIPAMSLFPDWASPPRM
uniref:Uncharacterized protein n=1 Tax=Mastacembelus armatus TaxID=205130 RepID=A0A3Q3MWV5_9TELE